VIPHDIPLQIGFLMFDGMDQIDLTGPFEVLSRLPNSTCQIYAKTGAPVHGSAGRHSFRHLRPWVRRLAENEGILAIQPTQPALHCWSC